MTHRPDKQGLAQKPGLPETGPAQPIDRHDAPAESTPRHTPQGAPTNAAHQDAGDGALTGSVPAGLTVEERSKRAREAGRDDPGAE